MTNVKATKKMLAIAQMRKRQAELTLKTAREREQKQQRIITDMEAMEEQARVRAEKFARDRFLSMASNVNPHEALGSIFVSMFKHRRDVASIQIKQTRLMRDYEVVRKASKEAAKDYHKISIMEDYCNEALLSHSIAEQDLEEERHSEEVLFEGPRTWSVE